MYMTGAAATMLIGVPYFLMLDSKVGVLVVLAIVISLIPHDMQYGPQAALIAESFPTRRRYSGPGSAISWPRSSRRPGAAAGHVAAAPLQQLAADRHLHRRRAVS
jgi:hypothetical protein